MSWVAPLRTISRWTGAPGFRSAISPGNSEESFSGLPLLEYSGSPPVSYHPEVGKNSVGNPTTGLGENHTVLVHDEARALAVGRRFALRHSRHGAVEALEEVIERIVRIHLRHVGRRRDLRVPGHADVDHRGPYCLAIVLNEGKVTVAAGPRQPLPREPDSPAPCPAATNRAASTRPARQSRCRRPRARERVLSVSSVDAPWSKRTG